VPLCGLSTDHVGLAATVQCRHSDGLGGAAEDHVR
jgi:hypothetical protein